MYRPLTHLRNLRINLPPVNIVVLGKYPDIFEGFRENADMYAPDFHKIFVRDGDKIAAPAGPWHTIQGPEEFSMAGNANLGWKAVVPGSDLLYIGDDVRFLSHSTVEILRQIAYSNKDIGMLSPKIVGGADNPLQTNPPECSWVRSDQYLALVCTYIKREVIEKVGYLDSFTFKGYGWEDVDYSRRVRQAGYITAVTSQVAVRHGIDRKGTESFLKNAKGDYSCIQIQADANEKAYLEKWGDIVK